MFEDTIKIKYEIFHTYKNANDNKYQINLKEKPTPEIGRLRT